MVEVATDYQVLWDDVLNNPMDAAPKLALSDWLEERGKDQAMVVGLRYCARYKKWPAKGLGTFFSDRERWRWLYRDGIAGSDLNKSSEPSRLAKKLWIEINGHSVDYWSLVFAERPETLIRRLGKALIKLNK